MTRPIPSTLSVRVPFAVRKRGGRKLVITPDGTTERPRPRVDSALVKAIARAHRWQRMLESGDYSSLTELAAAEKINLSYMSRVLRLTLLAPEIVEAILDGRQSEEVTLPAVMRPFPVGWGGQVHGRSSRKGSHPNPLELDLEERFNKFGLDVLINKTRPVAARTDAGNGYLNRHDNPGRVLLPPDITKCFAVRESLLNGRLTIFLRPLEGAVVPGDALQFSVGLQDDAMPAEVRSESVEIRIAEAETEKRPQPKRAPAANRSGSGKDRMGGGEDAPTRGLPKCILLTREGRSVKGYAYEPWPEGFDENDGGIVDDLGEDEVVYKINYDNAYHISYRQAQRGIVARDVVTEKYILGMRILLLGYERALRLARSRDGGTVNGIGEYADDFRRMAAKGAASTVLALAENLRRSSTSRALKRKSNDMTGSVFTS